MGKAKGRKSASKTPKHGGRRNPFDELNAADRKKASERVNSVLQKLLTPPESVMSHVARVGADFWVAPFGIDAEGKQYNRPCLVVPYDDLIAAELAHLSAGGELGAEYPEGSRAATSAAAKRAEATHIRGAEAALNRHPEIYGVPKKPSRTEAAFAALEEEDYPYGERPEL